MSDQKNNLTEGPISGRLLQMAWPMTVGIAASMAVPLADSYFLGQVDADSLTAISFAFPVVLSLMSLTIGLGAGTASVVSRAIGNGQTERAQRVATDSVALSLLLIIALSLFGFLTIRPLFALIGASGHVLDLIEQYMQLWYLGLPAMAVMMVGNNLLRANGDARTAGVIMVGVAIFNIALTPLLIFGWGPIPAMGIGGAAWAALIARVAALMAIMWAVVIRDNLLTSVIPRAAELMQSWKEISAIAIPAAFGNAVSPIGITIITGLIASFGDAAVAGFGVASRIESLVTIPMLALSASIGPIAGQNFGAEKHHRVLQAHQQSYLFSLCWSLVIAIGLWFAAPWLANAFSNDSEIADVMMLYLRIVPITLVGYGITVVAAGGFNAIGRPFTGLGMYLIRTAICSVPLVLVAKTLFDLNGVFMAMAVANLIAGLVIAAWSIRLLSTK